MISQQNQDGLREEIARAIIGATGIDGPSEGALLSARRQADRVIGALHLLAETVHVEGEWGFGARDDIEIRGYLR